MKQYIINYQVYVDAEGKNGRTIETLTNSMGETGKYEVSRERGLVMSVKPI